MASKKDATITPITASGLRRCIGSTTFGIGPHGAPVNDFPVQPGQKDGLGRMCKPHWTQYARALRRAAVARKATEATTEVAEAPDPAPEVPEAVPDAPVEPEAPAPRQRRRRKQAGAEPELEVAEPAAG